MQSISESSTSNRLEPVRVGNYILREAEQADKDAVINIRDDVYGGLDFLPEFYESLVTMPHGKAFVALYNNKVIWFATTFLVDDGKLCAIKGLRISKEHEGKRLLQFFTQHINEWARSKGALKYVFTNTENNPYAQAPLNKHMITMHHLMYILKPECISLQRSDTAVAEWISPISFDQLATYIRSPDISQYLFPSRRIMIDYIPYKLIESNLSLMKEMSGYHTEAFSDVRVVSDKVRGVLSFRTLFRAQKVSYVYSIEMYGMDEASIREHIARHLLDLQKKVTGSVCLMFLVDESFPMNIAHETCMTNGMTHVNGPNADYPEWQFQKEYIMEREWDKSQIKKL